MRENQALDFYSKSDYSRGYKIFKTITKRRKVKPMKSLIFFVEQFSVEYQKWSWIAFVLLTTLCGWPEKIRSTISNNQMWHENQLAFSRASVRLPVSEPVLWLVVVILRFWFLRRSFENLLWMRWLTKTDKIQILVIKIDIFYWLFCG